MDSADIHHGFTVVHMDASDAYMEAVRTTIKVELTERAWDRGDLASRSGLTYVTIGRLLRNEAPLTMPYLISLAAAFGWSAGELLLKAESRLRDHGRTVPGDLPPESAALIDSSTKLTRRQREQAKRALKSDPHITQVADLPTSGEHLRSPERRPRSADAG